MILISSIIFYLTNEKNNRIYLIFLFSQFFVAVCLSSQKCTAVRYLKLITVFLSVQRMSPIEESRFINVTPDLHFHWITRVKKFHASLMVAGKDYPLVKVLSIFFFFFFIIISIICCIFIFWGCTITRIINGYFVINYWKQSGSIEDKKCAHDNIIYTE